MQAPNIERDGQLLRLPAHIPSTNALHGRLRASLGRHLERRRTKQRAARRAPGPVTESRCRRDQQGRGGPFVPVLFLRAGHRCRGAAGGSLRLRGNTGAPRHASQARSHRPKSKVALPSTFSADEAGTTHPLAFKLPSLGSRVHVILVLCPLSTVVRPPDRRGAEFRVSSPPPFSPPAAEMGALALPQRVAEDIGDERRRRKGNKARPGAIPRRAALCTGSTAPTNPFLLPRPPDATCARLPSRSSPLTSHSAVRITSNLRLHPRYPLGLTMIRFEYC